MDDRSVSVRCVFLWRSVSQLARVRSFVLAFMPDSLSFFFCPFVLLVGWLVGCSFGRLLGSLDIRLGS